MTARPSLPIGTIPAGATHFYFNPQRPNRPSTDPWRKSEDGIWMMHTEGGWVRIAASKQHLFVALDDYVADAGWNGDGNPPVGTLCETMILGESDWFQNRIVFVGDVYVVMVGAEGEAAVPLHRIDFRPIKTAEQVAAEAMVAGVREMDEVVRATSTYLSPLSDLEALWKAGYRKLQESTV